MLQFSLFMPHEETAECMVLKNQIFFLNKGRRKEEEVEKKKILFSEHRD